MNKTNNKKRTKRTQKNGWNKKGPSWNFTKYLINEDGKLINRFSPRTSPLSTEIISKL